MTQREPLLRRSGTLSPATKGCVIDVGTDTCEYGTLGCRIIHPSDPRPAIDVASADEQRALRIAVTYALRQGLASDDLESNQPSNRSLVAIGRKLGVTIPDWCEAPDA